MYRHIQLRTALETRIEKGEAEIDIVGWMGRTALELVGQAGLGYSFDPLTHDRKDDYGNALKDFVYVQLQCLSSRHSRSYRPSMAALGPLLEFLPLAESLVPESWLRHIAKILPIPALHRIIANGDMMRAKAREILQQKRRALELGDDAVKMQVGEGKDIMSVLSQYPHLAWAT